MDSDDMVPCWGVKCYACKQFQHDDSWSMGGAVKAWNNANPVKTGAVQNLTGKEIEKL
ncbi:MAG: hypothetical protein Q8R83_06165 [Legionellaceae bacterium]|nr:hypothetical protein [Legionellaceae bacterium]